ncbi:hypothetical protein CC86DRAFT_472388 [Ophiobolus disseminans]|uniref:HAD-like protein n=1 Tax=Ophiobolus disseminans TaxID=1469910 RepID=A0A6A6ZDL4_9PLEO|nr:hypothetical protein CC86DRAFT_472388 [Ophiobolus disseminans]
MQATKCLAAEKNLLLCLDAFGTLFTPSVPIPVAYARAAAQHGIDCGDTENAREVGARFKDAFKDESKNNPNYGRATGLGAEKWWGNVIRNTFTPFTKPGQEVPPALITDLLRRYSTREGYNLKPGVKEFFQRLQSYKSSPLGGSCPWPVKKIIVGVITNSDDRVPGILESFGLRIDSRRFTTSSKPAKYTSVESDVDFVVLSYDVGHEKPDRRIFDAATTMLTEMVSGEQSGLTAEDFEKLYVGDDFKKDYDGARAAGWHAVLLDRDGVMDKVKNFRLGRIRMKKKHGQGKRVMARSILDLELWRPIGTDGIDVWQRLRRVSTSPRIRKHMSP